VAADISAVTPCILHYSYNFMITYFFCPIAIAYSMGQIIQDAELSQRDCAAGCVIVLAKSGRLELGVNILWSFKVIDVGIPLESLYVTSC